MPCLWASYAANGRKLTALDTCGIVSDSAAMRGRGAMQGWNLAAGVLRRLLIVAFALRAVIPVGFMPDLAALGQERVEIVICTGIGAQSIEVDADGQPVKPGPSDRSSTECPFAATFATAVLSPVMGEVEIARLERSEPVPVSGATALRPAVRGAPLGSRAPPLPLA